MPALPLELIPVAELFSARQALQRGQVEQALDLFQAAAEAHPRNLRVKIEFAHALAQSYRAQAAVAQLADAADIGGNDPRVASELAKAYARLYRVDLAAESLLAPEDSQLPPAIRAALAVYLEQLGRFDEAIDQISRVMAAAPNQPEPALVYARLLGHTGKHAASLETAQRVLANTADHAVLLKVRGLYQVVEMSDRLGEYGRAVEVVEQAKALQRSMPATASMADAHRTNMDRLEALYERLGPDILRRWQDESTPTPLRNGIVPAHLLGSPRSGTTLLEQPLSAHPDLCVSSERIEFAARILPQMVRGEGPGRDRLSVIDGLRSEERERLRAEYVRTLSATHSSGEIHGVHLDKKPANLFHLYALLRLLPESRWIIAIRDPRDVVISQYLRYFPMTDMVSHQLSWEDTARSYSRLMNIWLKMRSLLDVSTWMEVRYEDACKNIVATANQVFGFLGLSPHDRVSDYLAVSRKSYVHSPTFTEVRKPVHQDRLMRWKNYEQHIEPVVGHLKPMIEAFGYE